MYNFLFYAEAQTLSTRCETIMEKKATEWIEMDWDNYEATIKKIEEDPAKVEDMKSMLAELVEAVGPAVPIRDVTESREQAQAVMVTFIKAKLDRDAVME